MKDFTTNVETSGSGKVGGGQAEVGAAEVSANMDTVDGLTPVSMVTKKAHMKSVRNKFHNKYVSTSSLDPSFSSDLLTPPSFLRKVKKNQLDLLGLTERDKLTFVYQTIYNTGPVKLIRKSTKDGSISASCQKILTLFVKVNL